MDLSIQQVNAILNRFLKVLPLSVKGNNLQWQNPTVPTIGLGFN
jgi:hypothetical protein